MAVKKRTQKADAEPRVFLISNRPDGRHDVMKQQVNVGDPPKRGENDFSIFEGLADGTTAIIRPPHNPFDLEALVQKSSVLPPLIEAMEVNIDGTGAEIIPVESAADQVDARDFESEQEKEQPPPPMVMDEEGNAIEDPLFVAPEPEMEMVTDEDGMAAAVKEIEDKQEEEMAGIEDFFAEPWPGESFLTQRRHMRRDLESIGNAYLEVARFPTGEVAGCRVRDAKRMRLIKLDEPVEVSREVTRNGQTVSMEYLESERRYLSIVGSSKVYYKEFGSKRHLHRETGLWEGGGVEEDGTGGQEVPLEKRASEVIHYTNKIDIHTPYGVPRWISNVPNVVGARRAEEFNLEFFASSGIPPMLILVSGGALAEEAVDALKDNFLSGANRHTAAVLEAFGTSGDMDSTSNVRVTVERFEQKEDLQFKEYMKISDERTQRSFRLPNLFMGQGDSANFATAFVEMMVTDAQVFGPERTEFDEVVNLKLMPEMPNGELYLYRSLPLAITNLEQQLQAIDRVADKVEPESLVSTVNQLADIELVSLAADAMPEAGSPPPFGAQPPEFGAPVNEDATPGNAPKPQAPDSAPGEVNKSASVLTPRLATMAKAAAILCQQRATKEQWDDLDQEINDLEPDQYREFRVCLADQMFGAEVSHDPEAAAELAAHILRASISRAYGDGR